MFISVSSQATLNTSTNKFVFGLYDASAPSVLLESQAPAKPYPAPIQVSFLFNCVVGHLYIIRLWESVDTTPTGTLRNSLTQGINLTGNASVVTKFPEYLEADVTSGMTSGTTSYVNTDWAGWVYTVERIGTGTMVPDSSADTDPNYHQSISGGFNLIQTGDVFQPNEKFVATFTPQVTNPPATGSVLFTTGQIITANKVLTNSDSAQALFAQASLTNLQITLPLLSTLSDYTFFYIYSNGGSQKNVVIPTQGSDKIQYEIIDGTNQVNKIIIGKNENIILYKANGVFNVENFLPGVQNVGEIIYQYLYAPLNSLPCAGQLVSRAEYPRLWAYISNLPASLVTDIQWSSTFVTIDTVTYYTNQGFFSTGDGSTTFRLPLISNFLRPIQFPAIPGTLELQTIQRHLHGIDASKQNTGLGGFGSVPGVNPDPSEDGGNVNVTGGDETKPTNIGFYALIRT